MSKYYYKQSWSICKHKQELTNITNFKFMANIEFTMTNHKNY